MSHVRRMGSASPAERIRSPTPPGIEKDSLNSSTHSESQVPNLSDKEITSPALHVMTKHARKSIHTLENLDENKETIISTNSVINNNNDYSHHNGYPLSQLSDSGTYNEDLRVMSPSSDLISPDQLDAQDGQLYQEVLEALSSTNLQPVLSEHINTQPEKKV